MYLNIAHMTLKLSADVRCRNIAGSSPMNMLVCQIARLISLRVPTCANQSLVGSETPYSDISRRRTCQRDRINHITHSSRIHQHCSIRSFSALFPSRLTMTRPTPTQALADHPQPQPGIFPPTDTSRVELSLPSNPRGAEVDRSHSGELL